MQGSQRPRGLRRTGSGRSCRTGTGWCRWDVFPPGCHLNPDFLPFVIVTDGGVADALGSRTGHFVAAGPAVALGTGLTDLAHTVSGQFDAFVVIHTHTSFLSYVPYDFE